MGLTIDDPSEMTESLGELLRSSRFLPAACSVCADVVVEIEGERFLVHTGDNRLRISTLRADDKANPDLIVRITRSAVLSGDVDGRIAIQTGKAGQQIHPSFERVFLRCLNDRRKVSCEDIIDLFYSPLFDFCDAENIWTSSYPQVSIHHFDWVSRGCAAFVSCGLHRLFPLQPFELALLAPRTEGLMARELVGWTKYALEENVAYRTGEWLEYAEGAIPGTRFAGFLLVPPVLLPRQLPAYEGTASLLLVLPVTSTELARAKETTSVEVAQSLFENGVRDFRS